ncbi:hypothetical protein ACFCYC_05460 [Streptomyces sp. NPDC056402]|uniref:hypothetical protein n=1 Tax=Streptomyces sp. NPDC056402 TaxID=3345810 RepID=UPI0035D7EF1A
MGVVYVLVAASALAVEPSAAAASRILGHGDVLGPEAYSNSLAYRAVDWENRNYDLTCDQVVEKPVKVQMRKGKGVVSGGDIGGFDRWDVEVQKIAQGSLPRLGGVTAVLFRCSPQPGNFFSQELRIYRTGSGSEIGRTATFETPELPPQYQPKSLVVKDGRIAADVKFYEPEDSHASGPSTLRHVTWTWGDGRFTTHVVDVRPEDRGEAVDLRHQPVTVNGMGPLKLGMSRGDAAKAIGSLIPGKEGRRVCTDFSVEGAPEGLLLRFTSDRLVAIYVVRPATKISTRSGAHIGSARDDVLRTYGGEIAATTPDYGGEELVFAPVAPKFAGRVIRFSMSNGVVESFIAGEREWARIAPSCGGPE